MDKIQPTTILKENEVYTLPDTDYVLIKALQELAYQIGRLASKK